MTQVVGDGSPVIMGMTISGRRLVLIKADRVKHEIAGAQVYVP